MRDFTLRMYEHLLRTAQAKGYRLVSYLEFVESERKEKLMVLRHDVDALPQNSLDTAILENSLGARGSYYFRVVSGSFNETVMAKIKALGHEIGYHYEDLAMNGGDFEKSWEHFKLQLERFRKISDIKTICMHGSPLSKWDNRDLWKKYDYRSLGIVAEPYFDTDFNQVFYITDTGRKWNNSRASVRDKVSSGFKTDISSTEQMIALLEQEKLPGQIMINIHPQRWTNNPYFWTKELLWQNMKNAAKSLFIKLKAQ
jgi:hypothetical protein